MNPSNDAEWIVRGLVSASECFSCLNKLDHKIEGRRVFILCKDYCNYLEDAPEDE